MLYEDSPEMQKDHSTLYLEDLYTFETKNVY